MSSFLFILESIGTPELLLIAVVALIILGPRKLPQMAKTVAKTMAEFRNATNEFKTTWEREVAFENDSPPDAKTNSLTENSILPETAAHRDYPSRQNENNFPSPQIKELNQEEIYRNFQPSEKIKDSNEAAAAAEEETKKPASDKRDWL